MKLIMRFLKPHRKLFIVTVLLLILDVVGALFIPTLSAEMLNMGTSGSSFSELLNTGVQMAAVSLLSGACAILGGYTCAVLSARIGKDIRMAIYEKSLKLSVFDFRQFGTASITTRTVSDINTIQMALSSTIQMILPVPVICVIALALCFYLDVQMGLILLIAVFIVLLLAWGIMYSAAPLFKRLQKLLDRMSTVLLENLTGVRVVRAFNNENREENRMSTAFAAYAETSIKANRRFANLDGISFFFINLFVVIVYWLSGGKIAGGNFQIGDITATISYAMMVMFFLMMAQMVILTLPRALECCDRIQEVLDHSPEIQDLVTENPEEPADRKENVLEFRDVSFRFADAEENTLNHLNFSCRRGETTAIIAGTGSGKSTVASLILRFHDVTEGQVCLNGTDVRDMTQSFLRDHLAYVQQKAWLFSGTIASNLRYSRKDAADEELMHAADVAQAGDFIRSLPDGLNSFVAQGGTNFSGGQKQRLSIARALVKKPELYIFDDSFSALDFKTDAALRKALAEETKDAAVLIIAQRVSTIRHAHQIVVLHEGEMVGLGTHEELIENCPVYREIYESQTKEAQEA
ncbi:multidrug ABC transporter ATP-binding protein [Lachnoclostridium sp. An196]|uniref:ABC transporter ATP-binding protein n=1 Tax=Lachnoclostridium sp. An196 TaxID=1965583 RepID=UPI000B3A2BB7|nr:ABC transporter ATP-binding protein [Lachnoclostridium sp. An196]OUP21552.1 multidrug ABC transporter ATP-binding protein [Lachnoclostridium sp. An196]